MPARDPAYMPDSPKRPTHPTGTPEPSAFVRLPWSLEFGPVPSGGVNAGPLNVTRPHHLPQKRVGDDGQGDGDGDGRGLVCGVDGDHADDLSGRVRADNAGSSG